MNQLVTSIASGIFSATAIAAGIKYIGDRRTLKAKGAVAEQTVGLDVDAAKLANLDHRLALVEKAHDQEVEALQATIKNLKDRLDYAMSRIALLERRVQFEDARYRAAMRYIHALRAWIAQHVPGMDPPAIPPALDSEFNGAPDGDV